jgi:hypothetical protein
MDMDVLCRLIYEPPMLYLLLVMISWSIGLVPRLARQQQHRLVWLSAILHLVVYAALVSHVVPEVSWTEIAFAASRITFLLTLGGYLLHWVTCLVAADVATSFPGRSICKRQSDHT